MTDIFKYSEQRRNDPELRAKVTQVAEARKVALLEAAKKLEEALDILRPLDRFEGDAIYRRCASAAWSAHYQVSGDALFMNKALGDTYIGNLAAGELGYQIQQMGDNFEKFLPKEK